MIRPFIKIAIVIAVTGLLAACAGQPAQPQRLYQLNAQAPAGNTALPKNLGLGPLKWPEYLNRRQIVVRLDAGRIETLDNDRWAEALDTNFERVLREDLVRVVHPQRLQSYPWSLNDAPEINVPIEILQLDTDTQGNTVLRARWRIVARDKREIAAERDTAIRLTAHDTSPAATVACQSEALARLAQEIGQSVTR